MKTSQIWANWPGTELVWVEVDDGVSNCELCTIKAGCFDNMCPKCGNFVQGIGDVYGIFMTQSELDNPRERYQVETEKPDFGEGWEECSREDAEEYCCRRISFPDDWSRWNGIGRITGSHRLQYSFRRRVKPEPEIEARYPIEWNVDELCYVVRFRDDDFLRASTASDYRDPEGREFAGYAYDGNTVLYNTPYRVQSGQTERKRATHAVYRVPGKEATL